MRRYLLISMFLFGLFAFGCVDESFVKADDSGATPEAVSAVVEAENAFAFKMYSELSEEGGNVFFSPYSISSAFSICYEGARGTTADEMIEVFGFPEEDSVRRPAFARLYNTINEPNGNYELSTVNALWVERTYQLLPDYIETCSRYYNANATNLDFIGDSEGSRGTINGWVEGKTNGRIKDLIPSGAIDGTTRAVITNAIYFKGKWVRQFDKERTQKMDFWVSKGNSIRTEMMMLEETADFDYMENEDLQALEMPYEGGRVSMLVLLPKEIDGLGDLEQMLDEKMLYDLRNQMGEEEVFVYFPKFRFETKYRLNENLMGMGMPSAFSTSADFSGMDGSRNLYISDVFHQAFVDVNEEGTEAAAATGIFASFGSAGTPYHVFKADHPFIFLIVEKDTGHILFMGRMANPK